MRKNFESVYKLIANPTKRFIAKHSGADEQAVEDIFSATMVAVWKGWGVFENKSSYFTWICRIALNKIADYYRKEIHRNSEFIAPFLEDLVEPNKLSAEESLVLEELKNSVQKCLNLLPESKRRVLHLRYWEDKSVAEIAKIMGISYKAAEGRLYRAKRAFSWYNHVLCKQSSK